MPEVTDILESPLFVIGPGRGGTTHLQQLLLADPRFCGGQESHFFEAFASVLDQFDRKLSAERTHGLGCYWRREDLVGQLREFWRLTFTECVIQKPGAGLLVEKTPSHSRYISVIDQVLPKARFLHIVRDSRAVAASLMAAYRAGWGKSWAAGTARGAADQWNRSIATALEGSRRLSNNRYLRIKYEDLLKDQASTMNAVYRWLGQEPAAPESGPELGGMWFGGELLNSKPDEPHGFVRRRGVLGWRKELRWWEQQLVWWMTRRQMTILGYSKHACESGPNP